MNITPQAPNLSIPTVLNPHTESLRRENNQREIITQPSAPSQSAAEKGVASDKERGRTPAQNNANIDFASISKQAELANSSISEQKDQQNQEKNQQTNQESTQDSAESKSSSQEAKEQSATNHHGEEQSRQQELEQARIISELQKRDKEVRAHESAHAAVGGSVTGAPSLSYKTGPDGKRYAVEGEVSVDLSTVKGNPSATIAKMQKVHAAALAPVQPSVQDTRVASIATQKILQAQSELLAELSQERSDDESRNGINANNEASISKGRLSSSEEESASFDALINRTFESQDRVAPTQSVEVVQRSLRIASFYAGITQAYEKPSRSQFELTA